MSAGAWLLRRVGCVGSWEEGRGTTCLVDTLDSPPAGLPGLFLSLHVRNVSFFSLAATEKECEERCFRTEATAYVSTHMKSGCISTGRGGLVDGT